MTRSILIVCVILTVTIWIITTVVISQLPDQIPIHWNLQGEVDQYGSKWFGTLLVPSIMIGVLVLAVILPSLSPKQFTVESFSGAYSVGMLLALGCVGYVQLVLLWGAMAPQTNIGRALLAGISLFWALIGTVLGKLRRNFWMGIRTPWTLASDRVWNETHRMAGKLFMFTGMLGLMILAIGLKPSLSTVIIVALILGNSLIAVGYSLVKYRRLERMNQI